MTLTENLLQMAVLSWYENTCSAVPGTFLCVCICIDHAVKTFLCSALTFDMLSVQGSREHSFDLSVPGLFGVVCDIMAL